MGCLHSKKDAPDPHPNVFRVINIDENGADLCSGQLEITDSNIVLYRQGRESTVWPLHSLRRYGFDEDLFSFESGRRCDTGEGIYAFKCSRAPALFRKLQNQISIRNNAADSGQYPATHLNPSPHGRQALHASVVHRSSIDNSQPDISRTATIGLSANVVMPGLERNINQSFRSPSISDILEVTPLHPHSETIHNPVSNVYQLRDFKKEHNNNQDLATDPVHLYSNDFNRDLAFLRSKFKKKQDAKAMRDDEDESFLVESKYANSNFANLQPKSPISPTLSSSSEHYAQLNLEQQESARYYINVKLDKTWQDRRNEVVPSTPPTPGGKQVEYSNLSLGPRQEISTYANLSLGEIADNFRNKQGQKLSTEHFKFSDSDTFTSMSPVEELEVNYAVLDIDGNKEIVKLPKLPIVSPTSQNQVMTSNNSPKKECIPSSSLQKRQLMFQSSVDNTSYDSAPTAKSGYTTIDFDKTVALTSVAAESDVDSEGARKMRHNSCNIVCGSPNNGDKSRNNN